MLNQIGQIAVNVKDVSRAVAFYRDVLGMKFLFEAPGLGFFDCGGVRLMLGRAETDEFDHPTSILYYRVDDIESACAALRAKGVEIEQGPSVVHKTETQELRIAFFHDTEGNPLALMSEVHVGA